MRKEDQKLEEEKKDVKIKKSKKNCNDCLI